MQPSVTVIFLVIFVIGIFAAVFIARHLRDRAAADPTPKLPLSQRAKAIITPNDPSVRSPAGSMAARREDIEDLLRGKEDQPG
jgi:hypothetical protein